MDETGRYSICLWAVRTEAENVVKDLRVKSLQCQRDVVCQATGSHGRLLNNGERFPGRGSYDAGDKELSWG